jgi:inorganic pyrophosphatase/exopolyphosphatase
MIGTFAIVLFSTMLKEAYEVNFTLMMFVRIFSDTGRIRNSTTVQQRSSYRLRTSSSTKNGNPSGWESF